MKIQKATYKFEDKIVNLSIENNQEGKAHLVIQVNDSPAILMPKGQLLRDDAENWETFLKIGREIYGRDKKRPIFPLCSGAELKKLIDVLTSFA